MSSLPQARIDEVRRLFQSFLKERGQRQTPERMAILDTVYDAADHFDADELFGRLRSQGFRVSRATVYNTLELLLDCGLVVKHQFGKNQAKFERAYAYWQHDHLICIDCGKIVEFCDPRLQGIQDTVAEIFGFTISHHSLHLYGHCHGPDCPGSELDSDSRTHRPAPSDVEEPTALT